MSGKSERHDGAANPQGAHDHCTTITAEKASYWTMRSGVQDMSLSSISHSAAIVAATLTICLAGSVRAHAQCAGLHAGITAQFVQVKPGYTEPAHVQLVFILINDSDATVDVRAGSWRIVIDGVELQDSDWLFGNGPMPAGGWTTLEAGQYYELGKALPISKYFPEAGEHKISWRGNGVRSSTITIRVPTHP
jgi:hypothetical protein